jgi:hypothetical protein
MAFLFLGIMDLAPQLPDEVFDMHGGLRVLMEQVESAYEKALRSPLSGMSLKSMLSGKVMHCLMGGTFPGVKSKGIGKALRMRAVQVAKERGMNALVVEPGHEATRHIWTKYCGGQILSEVQSDSFKSKSGVLGEYPLKGVDGSVSVCQVVINKPIWDTCFCWPCSFVQLLALLNAKKKKANDAKEKTSSTRVDILLIQASHQGIKQ